MSPNDQPLAYFGGSPAVTMPLAAWPPADDAIRAALESALEDGSWGRYEGRHGDRLIERLAAMHGLDHVLLCSSGTVAVELALRGAGVEPGDEVILAAYDFPGNFRAVEAIGAVPVLVDVEPTTWCLDSQGVLDAVGPQTRAILVSHLHGGLAAMPSLCRLVEEHTLRVVEDACQAPGAEVAGRPVGAWGDASTLSFGGSKLLTAGRGGALMTRHANVHQRAKIFAERGNNAFPLSELQAAVLSPQLDRLDERNTQRQKNVILLTERLAELPGIDTLLPREEGRPVFYKLPFLLDKVVASAVSRDEFVEALKAEGAPVGAGFRGFVRRSVRRCRKVGDLANSRRAAEQTILLHHTALSAPPETVQQIAEAFEKVHAALVRAR